MNNKIRAKVASQTDIANSLGKIVLINVMGVAYKLQQFTKHDSNYGTWNDIELVEQGAKDFVDLNEL